MAPRKNNLIPDMRETRYKTKTFANPYAPAAPKQTAFRTPKMSATAMPNRMYNDEDAKLRTPFKGDDPFSMTARTMWDLPGTISQGFSNVFTGKTKISDEQWSELAANVALTGMAAAAGIAAGRSTLRARASTRSLAAARIRQAEEIAANRESARLQFRNMVEQRQAARRQRRSTVVKANRLLAVERALRDTDPALAQSIGDRGWAALKGLDIRLAKKGQPGVRNETMPRTAIGHSHGMHVPLEDAVPSNYYQQIWIREIGNRLGRPIGSLYPSGTPMITRSSGTLKRPNLRTRLPLYPNYSRDGARIIDPEGPDEFTRGQIQEWLDEATTFRNRSASIVQGTPATGGRGRYAYPRIYDQTVTYPSGSFDPAKYQIDAFDSFFRDVYKGTKKIKPKPRRLGGGK